MNLPLSIIIPVYNVKDYLETCLDSVLTQSFGDFELILVDDGSSDGSEAICDAYAQKDPRVRVFHQKNQGQASARNEGVKLAQGEWVAFVDSDDIVPDGSVAQMMACRKESVDVIIGRISRFEGTPEHLVEDQDDFSDINTQGLSGVEAFSLLLERVPAPLWSPCRNYLRRSFWQSISASFPVGITSEDMHLFPRVQMAAREIALCNEVVYYYRYARPNSTMTGKSLSRELCFFKVVAFYKEYFIKHPQHKAAREGLLRQFGKLQYPIVCRMGNYNREERKQIMKAALPHADLIKNCVYARRWKLFFTLLGSRITYKLMVLRHKGR